MSLFSFAIELLSFIETDFRYVLFDMSSWARDNPATATLMLISGADAYPKLIFRKFAELQRMGYTTLLAYPQQVYFPFDSREWLWETLLKGVCPLSLALFLLKQQLLLVVSELVSFFHRCDGFKGDKKTV